MVFLKICMDVMDLLCSGNGCCYLKSTQKEHAHGRFGTRPDSEAFQKSVTLLLKINLNVLNVFPEIV